MQGFPALHFLWHSGQHYYPDTFDVACCINPPTDVPVFFSADN
jgi:hypothetical protein